jgi:hypothetical protein
MLKLCSAHKNWYSHSTSSCTLQSLLPGNLAGGWNADCLGLLDCDQAWRQHYDRTHELSPYLPSTHRKSVSPISTDTAFPELCTGSGCPSVRDIQPKTVREFSRSKLHGVWYPGMDLKLSWRGGKLPRPDLPEEPFTPFVSQNSPECLRLQKAVSLHFTEPGKMRKWTWCPVWDISKLSSPYISMPRIQEQSVEEDCLRGAEVIVSQNCRPSFMDCDQWKSFASLRAFPLQQVPKLCAVLHGGVLSEALDKREVQQPTCQLFIKCSAFSVFSLCEWEPTISNA